MRSQVIKFKEKAFFTFVNILKRGIAIGNKDLLVILRGKNENFLKWLSILFFRNQQLTRHFFPKTVKWLMYVYMYIFFFQGLEGIPWWSWFILAIVLLGKDRGGNILQICKDISQFRKDISQFSKRYSAIFEKIFCNFAKIFRNFRKDIPQFCKDISQFCKDIPQFSKRYSAIFAKIFRNFRKDIPQFSLNESRPGRRSVIYIYPVMNPNTFPS